MQTNYCVIPTGSSRLSLLAELAEFNVECWRKVPNIKADSYLMLVKKCFLSFIANENYPTTKAITVKIKSMQSYKGDMTV